MADLRERAREYEFAFYDYSGYPETGYAVFVAAPVGIFCGYVLTEAKAKLMVELLNDRAAAFAERVVRECINETCSDCASGNKPLQSPVGFFVHHGTENGSWSGEPNKFERICRSTAIRRKFNLAEEEKR